MQRALASTSREGTRGQHHMPFGIVKASIPTGSSTPSRARARRRAPRSPNPGPQQALVAAQVPPAPDGLEEGRTRQPPEHVRPPAGLGLDDDPAEERCRRHLAPFVEQVAYLTCEGHPRRLDVAHESFALRSQRDPDMPHRNKSLEDPPRGSKCRDGAVEIWGTKRPRYLPPMGIGAGFAACGQAAGLLRVDHPPVRPAGTDPIQARVEHVHPDQADGRREAGQVQSRQSA